MSFNPIKYSTTPKILPAPSKNDFKPTERKKSEKKILDAPLSNLTVSSHVPSVHHNYQPENSLLESNLIGLGVNEKNIKALLEIAEGSDSAQITNINDIIEKKVPFFTDKIIQAGLNASTLVKTQTSINFPPNEDQLIVDLDLTQYLEPIILEETFAMDQQALLMVVAGNTLNRVGITLASGMLLNQIEDVVKAKKKSLEVVDEEHKHTLQNEIVILEKWVGLQSERFNNLLKETVQMTALTVPKTICAVAAVVTKGVTLAGAALYATTILDWVAAGAGLIRAALAWRDASKDIDTHDTWVQAISSSGTGALEIYKKQKEVYRQRLESTLTQAGVSFPKNATYEELQVYLDLTGVKEKYNAIVKEKEVLSVSLRNSLKTFSNKKESIDEGFLSLALHKARGIFTAAVIFSALAITLKVLVLAGAIASSAAMTATGFGVLAVLVGFMIGGAVYLHIKKPNMFKTYLQAVQARLAFWSIPHAIQKFRLSYAILEVKKVSENTNQLGLRILEIQKLLESKDNKKVRNYVINNLAYNELPGQILDDVNILENYQNELLEQKKTTLEESDSISKKMLGLRESVLKFEGKMKVMQDRIDEAGWEDFQHHLQTKDPEDAKLLEVQMLLKTENTNRIGEYVGKNLSHMLLTEERDDHDDLGILKAYELELKKQKETVQPKDNADILAEHLLLDATVLEDSMTKGLLEHMGIDVKNLKTLDPVVLKTEVAKVIRSFFAMETENTIDMIKKQNLMVKHGLQ